MGDVTKLVEVESTATGRSEILIDAQPSQFSDGYSLVLTPSEALRLAHALIARVTDIRTAPLAVPLLAPTLQVAA
ncbi:hypothetical protein EDF64_11134 [Curtobacterium flaccumfaciens]|uniref:Uncharacterized protein n=1 Tax=Curtobacterium flaccumfaciens TaxID=2035 RepID=A0A4R6DEZ8_9MICO|nr:hypothetical protein [Curtobacterium flaccumfaciens]TDN42559.1 hypothetical protein EDF64_11134 [Curtobacterium flaccumfaciens]